MSREEADEKLRLLATARSSYTRRAGKPRHDLNAGVYFIVGTDKVKIGRTERTPVDVRLARLQRNSPVPLHLHRFVALPFPDAVERALHTRFAAHHSHGEWFSVEILNEVNDMTDEAIGGLR